MSLQLPQNASPKKINDLTVATNVNPVDITVIVQDGVTKQAAASLFSNAVGAGKQEANATLSAIAAMSATVGMMAFLGVGNVTAVTLTGTGGEVTVMNGGGSGAPTFSLPTDLVFTGKTIAQGTFSGATLNNPTIHGGTISGATIRFSSLNVSGNATIGGNLTVSGNVDISGNETIAGSETIGGNLIVSGNATINGSLTVSGAVTLPQFLSSSAPSNLGPTASAGTSTLAAHADHVHQYPEDEFTWKASDETTPITTGTAKITFTIVLPRIVTSVQANLSLANSAGLVSGPLTIDINASGVSIFGTNKLVVSNGSTTSRDAATQPSFSATAFGANTVFTTDVDLTGSAATATGLQLTFTWRRNS